MAGMNEAAALTVTGMNIGLFLMSTPAVEVPTSKVSLKRQNDKTEVTGSTSLYPLADSNGNVRYVVWKEWSEGVHSGTLNSEAHWRTGMTYTPIAFIEGVTYPFRTYVRKPGMLSPSDVGTGVAVNLIIDDTEFDFDPKQGSISYKLNATFNGGPVLF